MGALLSPFPPVRHGVPLLARLAREPGLATARTLLSGVRGLGEERFGGEGPRLLLAGNAGARRLLPRGRRLGHLRR